MSLTNKHIKQLSRVINSLQSMLSDVARQQPQAKAEQTAKRRRRTGKELIAFRKALKTELKAGMPVSEIARKHGVTPAYIYGMR